VHAGQSKTKIMHRKQLTLSCCHYWWFCQNNIFLHLGLLFLKHFHMSLCYFQLQYQLPVNYTIKSNT